MHKGFLKSRRKRFDETGYVGVGGSRIPPEEDEITMQRWNQVKSECMVCVGSMICDKHKPVYEAALRYDNRRTRR